MAEYNTETKKLKLSRRSLLQGGVGGLILGFLGISAGRRQLATTVATSKNERFPVTIRKEPRAVSQTEKRA